MRLRIAQPMPPFFADGGPLRGWVRLVRLLEYRRSLPWRSSVGICQTDLISSKPLSYIQQGLG
ncbi:hypothetical protein POG22_15770, partial [Geitlerinema sp. CS-897]|nr:hypothetical protein [Geitlerinema sp. CS-897]